MDYSYRELTTDLSSYIGKLRKEIPEVMQGFGQLAQATKQAPHLDKKTKELIALALGIAKQCEGCIGFHMKDLISLGVTRGELLDTLAMSIYMGGGPSLMYAAQALRAFEELSEPNK